MNTKLICTLNNNYVFLISNKQLRYYISLPKNNSNYVNLSVILKGEQDSRLSEFRQLDNTNCVLLIPILNSHTVSNISTDNDVKKLIDSIIKNAYNFLTKNKILVNRKLFLINNNKLMYFQDLMLELYKSNITVKTIYDLQIENKLDIINHDSKVDILNANGLNFIIGGYGEGNNINAGIDFEELDDSDSIIPINTEVHANAGFASYIFLGFFSVLVSLGLILLLIKK